MIRVCNTTSEDDAQIPVKFGGLSAGDSFKTAEKLGRGKHLPLIKSGSRCFFPKNFQKMRKRL